MGLIPSIKNLGSLASGVVGSPGGKTRVIVGGAAGDVAVSQANVLLGRDATGAGPAQEIPCTAFARTLLDDATQGAAQTTLGIVTALADLDDVSLTSPAAGDLLAYDSGAARWVNLPYLAAAEIHCHDASTAQSIPTGATYTKVTAFTDAGFVFNATADVANDQITLTKTGIYRVDGSFSFTLDTNNVKVLGTVFLNGVEQDNIHFAPKVGVGADQVTAAFTGFIDVTTVPWNLDFRVRHDYGSAVNLTVAYGNLNVSFVGPT